MNTDTDLEEYMAEMRQQVCSRCIEKPPGGPPCAPQGKRCGIELNLPRLIEAVQQQQSASMDPYIQHFHDEVCAHCENRPTNQCPCPLEHLLLLAVEAIETVDKRRQKRGDPCRINDPHGSLRSFGTHVGEDSVRREM